MLLPAGSVVVDELTALGKLAAVSDFGVGDSQCLLLIPHFALLWVAVLVLIPQVGNGIASWAD